jgi:predicted transcriptional regulator
MEVHLSADKEARLRDIATRSGKEASALVEEAVDRMLEQDARFLEAVEEGRADVRRGWTTRRSWTGSSESCGAKDRR